ncbi:MAG TPA: hypothetical protein VGM82_11840 [Gemmatimonadaceae bacterium]
MSKHTGLGERGIWWAFPVTNVIIVFVTLGVYAQGDWKRKRLVDPASVEEGAISNEIIADEGSRVA